MCHSTVAGDGDRRSQEAGRPANQNLPERLQSSEVLPYAIGSLKLRPVAQVCLYSLDLQPQPFSHPERSGQVEGLCYHDQGVGPEDRFGSVQGIVRIKAGMVQEEIRRCDPLLLQIAPHHPDLVILNLTVVTGEPTDSDEVTSRFPPCQTHQLVPTRPARSVNPTTKTRETHFRKKVHPL